MQIDLKALLNLPELEITSVEMTDDVLKIKCRSSLGQAICPSCQQKTQQIRKYYRRTIRDLPITGREVYLDLEERQFYCPDCDGYFSERFSFVEVNRTTTSRLEGYIYRCCLKSTIKAISVQENLLWDVVEGIFHRQASKLTHQIDCVRWLGIDEIALRKGHKNFACVLVDLQKGCVVDILKERTKAYLIAYFEEKGKDFLSQIEVFSSDMWEGFITVAETLMPNAMIVVDRFHVMSNLHRAIDSFRRHLRRNHKEEETLKNLRWLLLKHRQGLTEEELVRLEKAFDFAPQLEQMYQLKEDFRLWYDTFTSPSSADAWLNHWIDQAKDLNNTCLDTFISTLTNWRSKILNFFVAGITNGLVEGINNILKLILRRAFGYANFDHFRLRVLAECGPDY
jgi:transposase